MSLPSGSIDPNAERVKVLLSGIQGNILKSHGRKHAVHILLRFKANVQPGTPEHLKTQKWLAEFTDKSVTSALSQLQDTEHFKERRKAKKTYPGAFFGMILFTYTGYQWLGFKEPDIPMDQEGHFREGMGFGGRIPNDSSQSIQWLHPYNGDLHALIIMAHNRLDKLRNKAQNLEETLKDFCELTHVEYGHKLTWNFGKGKVLTVEQFGYADGISQPLFFKDEIDKETKRHGNPNIFWDPGAPLDLVLVQEGPNSETYGSFLVFRKLEQNVLGFKNKLDQLADMLGFTGSARDQVGAWAVGRFKDGTPLIKTTMAPASANELPNNFNFSQDSNGAICPFHAHIRKNNPRGELSLYEKPVLSEVLTIEEERGRRIVRRGITYGRTQREFTQGLTPNPVGVLFMSFQAKLSNFIVQQNSADDENWARPKTGLDPIVGRSSVPNIKQRWPSNTANEFQFADVVSLQGGQYFFAPSLQFLKNLSNRR